MSKKVLIWNIILIILWIVFMIINVLVITSEYTDVYKIIMLVLFVVGCILQMVASGLMIRMEKITDPEKYKKLHQQTYSVMKAGYALIGTVFMMWIALVVYNHYYGSYFKKIGERTLANALEGGYNPTTGEPNLY